MTQALTPQPDALAAVPIDRQVEALGDLARLVESQGRLTPAAVVDVARPEASALHGCFEWRDDVAAEQFRLHQARALIRVVMVRHSSDPAHQARRAFVSVHERDDVADSYQPARTIAVSSASREALYERFLEEVDALLQRFAPVPQIHGWLEELREKALVAGRTLTAGEAAQPTPAPLKPVDAHSARRAEEEADAAARADAVLQAAWRPLSSGLAQSPTEIFAVVKDVFKEDRLPAPTLAEVREALRALVERGRVGIIQDGLERKYRSKSAALRIPGGELGRPSSLANTASL